MVILENLVTEKRNEATEGLDQIPVAEALKLMNAEDKNVPWTLPAPVGAYLATGNDWRVVILVLVNLTIAGLIYYPFVKMYDKQMLDEEAKATMKKSVEAAV